MFNELFPSFLCQIERILCAFNLFVRLTWLRDYDVILSRWIVHFNPRCSFYLLSNNVSNRFSSGLSVVCLLHLGTKNALKPK